MLEFMTTIQVKKLTEPGLEIDPEVFNKLMASDGAPSDLFGHSVAVSGDGQTVVVGAWGDGDKGNSSGSVYIFTKQANGSYAQTQKLVPSDGRANDGFGFSVAVSGDGQTVVVGTPFDDDQGDASGTVYIFTKQANGSYLRIQKLVAADGAIEFVFGSSVVITADGSTIVVGATQNGSKATDAGSAYIFTKQSNGTYLQTQKLVAADRASRDKFGESVAITPDGSTVVVGAFQDDDKGSNSGSVYIFTKQANGSYLQKQKLVASDGAAGDWFGYSVAVSGDGSTVVIGAYRDDDKGSDSGSAYVFTKQSNGTYLQTQKLVASDGAPNDYFGYRVYVSGDNSTIIVGAYIDDDDDKGTNSGSVCIFTKQADGSYLQSQKLLASDGAANDYFGCSVAISNTSVVVGAQGHLTKGAVYVY